MWTDPGLKSGISVHELISTLKKSAGGELIVEPSPKILASEEKATILKFLFSDLLTNNAVITVSVLLLLLLFLFLI